MSVKNESRGFFAFLDAVLGRMSVPVWIFDIDFSRVVWANRAGCDLWKADTLEELRRRDFSADMSLTVASRLKEYQRAFISSDATFSEVWTHYPKGEPSTIRVHYSGVRLPDDRTAMLCEGGAKLDETPDKLRSAEALFHTSMMITLHKEDGSVLYSNPAGSSIRRQDAYNLREHFVDAKNFDALQMDLDEAGQGQIVAEVHTIFGIRWHEITARKCMDPVTGNPAWLTSEVDVSEIKRTEAQARYDAHHDPLTGLPNRTYVQSVFEERLAALLLKDRQSALLFIDLDRFKTINDSLGHAAGDHVLVEVAQRLSRAVDLRGDVARLGGDEFLVLVEFTKTSEIDALVAKVLEALHVPISWAGNTLQLTCSVGVSIAPTDGTDVAFLMKNSDSAMYGAKNAGGNRSAHYTSAMGLKALSRLKMEMELRSDFGKRKLQLFYQPRISLETGKIVSAEVLLRWPAAAGYIPPDTFIPVAEENGLIVPIGAWVLGEAARQQAAWSAQGKAISLSVNVSPRQLAERDFVEIARKAVSDAGCDATAIELEITERLLLDEQAGVSAKLAELRACGFRISIDDFGVGYSNLAELHRYPIDCLKIDKSFLADLDRHGPITELIVNMGKLMGFHIVAEGVETTTQLNWLINRGCDEYQGYLYSRPVPADMFEAILLGEAEAEANHNQQKLA